MEFKFTKQNAKVLALGIVIAACVFVIGYHCPFRALTGIECPGCGMTRALISLLQGNLAATLAYNAMLLPTIVLGVLLMIFYRDAKKRNAILWIWIALMLVFWIVRILNLL